MSILRPRWLWEKSNETRALREGSSVWMRYIHDEVRATCESKNWGYQIRRKSAVRDTPVLASLVDDYEWKLIPGAKAELPEGAPGFDPGTYYVLAFRPLELKFLFQHDTHHVGALGPTWQRCTVTEITLMFYGDVDSALDERVHDSAVDARLYDPPAEGWLSIHLADLTYRFKPNTFSYT